MNDVKSIIIHHSVTKDNPDSNNYAGICNYHQSKGWKTPCGYHYVWEYINGNLIKHIGRLEDENGAHTKENEMNFHSIGICVVGDFDKEYPTEELYEELSKDIVEIMKRYPNIEIDDIVPHSKYAPYKSCPGKNFDMIRLKRLISNRINRTNNKDIRMKQTYSLPDGEEIILEGNMHNGRFETPIRAILEKLDFKVNWTKEKTFIK